MKPIFFSLLIIMSLFAMNWVFPYENECPPPTEHASYQTDASTSANDSEFHGQVLTSTAYDSCMMNPQYFELPPDDYTGSLKDWFTEHPMPKVQSCKNCHSITNNSPTHNSPIENGLSPNEQLYKNRTRQENEQAAYERMMRAYSKEEEDSKTYTEIVKKYFAQGDIRKP